MPDLWGISPAVAYNNHPQKYTMIITTDLRAAIRSAEKKQPNRYGTNWELREKQQAEAFAKLTQSKKHKTIYAQAMGLRRESDRLAKKA